MIHFILFFLSIKKNFFLYFHIDRGKEMTFYLFEMISG